jgi:putative ABC transport system permease protein
VLLVACANLGSAFLARATERRHEMAVRKSLGAGTGRLLAQLFGEGMVVSLLGAAAGLAVGRALLAAVRALAPAGVPGLAGVRLDGTLLVFTLLLSLATAVLFSLLPALSAVGRGVATGALRAGRTGSTGPGERRVWNLLVAAEVALALVLLVGSGLLLRSFWQLSDVETGFSAEGVLTADLHLPASHYPEDPEKAAYYRRLGEHLAALPGVEAAGFINHLPLSGADANGRMEVEGGPEPTTDASYRVATAEYFSALEIPLLAGRLFDGRDDATAPHVVVVNQALAEQAWPGESAVGKRMTGGGMDRFWDQEIWAEVVGVVGNVRHRGLDQPPRPEVYFHTLQRPPQSVTAVVRAAGTPASVAAAVRRAATDLDDQVPLELAPMEEVMGRSLAQRRFTLLLLAAFAGLALLLTALGVYGVVSLSVSRRRRELGIRLALGARPGRVQRLVLSRAMAAVGLGLLAGLAGALALSRLLASLLFGVSPFDPPTFVAVAALLGAAALAASLVPAHRSSRIEPVEVIRAD